METSRPISGRTPDAETRHRIELIRDGMIGASFYLPDPAIFIYPFTDYLSLLFQRPLVFSFWKNDVCVFSSFSDHYFREVIGDIWCKKPAASIRIPKTSYSLTIYKFSTDDINPEKVEKKKDGLRRFKANFLSVDSKAMGIVSDLFSSEKLFPEGFFGTVEASLGTVHQPESYALPRETMPLDYRETLDLLKPMRGVIDEAFFEAIKSNHLKINKGKVDLTNVFAAVRTVPGPAPRYHEAFFYTAGLLLSERQKTELSALFKSGCGLDKKVEKGRCPAGCGSAEECILNLEYPLGTHSRSVADCVYSSGINDFGREASDQIWDVVGKEDLDDKKRRLVEECVYPEGQWLFYTPIHVGGTPWPAIFTFTPKDPSSGKNIWSWGHNYSFYRDVLQRTAAIIRQEALDIYKDLVAEKLVGHIKSWSISETQIIERVNNDWQKLAQTYPFPIVVLKPDDSGKLERLDVPGRGQFWIAVHDNPYFPRQVSWGIPGKKEIASRCKKEVLNYSTIEAFMEQSATAHTSHLLKVPLRILKSIAKAGTTPQVRDTLFQQIDDILDMHEFSTFMISSKRRDNFRRENIEQASGIEFKNLFRQLLDRRLVHLSEPEVSGNRASGLVKLIENRRIFIDLPDERNLKEVKVKYFRKLLIMSFDGLISNALRNIDRDNPKINIFLSGMGPTPGTKIFLIIENTVSVGEIKLKKIVDSLNSGGPDIVGVTTIHWACRACWDSNPWWEIIDIEGKPGIRAIIPIAEVKI